MDDDVRRILVAAIGALPASIAATGALISSMRNSRKLRAMRDHLVAAFIADVDDRVLVRLAELLATRAPSSSAGQADPDATTDASSARPGRRRPGRRRNPEPPPDRTFPSQLRGGADTSGGNAPRVSPC